MYTDFGIVFSKRTKLLNINFLRGSEKIVEMDEVVFAGATRNVPLH